MKRFFKIVLVMCSMLLLTGCGSKSAQLVTESTMDAKMDYGATEEAAAEEVGIADANAQGAELPVDTGRKLIKTVNLDMETEDFDTLLSGINSKVEEAGGYVENSGVSGRSYRNGNENRTANMTLRIPIHNLNVFIDYVSASSNIVNKNESVEDITLKYIDTQSHKKALDIEQERLFALLEKADNMESIIALETRLSEIRYELQNLEYMLRIYDNQVDYSTVYLYITEVERYTPAVEKTTWSRISTGFSENVYQIGRGLKYFVVEFIVCIPYLFLLAVIGLLIYLIVRMIIKGEQKKAEKRMEHLKNSKALSKPENNEYAGDKNEQQL